MFKFIRPTVIACALIALASIAVAQMGSVSKPAGYDSPARQTMPAVYYEAIEPSDTVAVPVQARAIYVGTGGDITLRGPGLGGELQDVLFRNVPSGCVLPIRPVFIKATGTTADDFVLLW